MPDNEIAVHGEVAVSIIVTARNARKNLPRCLRALRDQSLRIYADMEAIVADCGSADRTYELSLEFQRADPGFFRIHRQTNADTFCAQKAGLALARGKYVAFCGADDAVPPDRFRALYEACEESGARYAASGEAKIWDRTLRGMLVRRDFLLAHGLPVKDSHDRAEQLAAYNTLRRLAGPQELTLFCTGWVQILRGTCFAEYRAGKAGAAFYEKMISLANEPQAEEVMAYTDRKALDRAHRKFNEAFAMRDWIRLEKMMKQAARRPPAQ